MYIPTSTSEVKTEIYKAIKSQVLSKTYEVDYLRYDLYVDSSHILVVLINHYEWDKKWNIIANFDPKWPIHEHIDNS